HLCAPLPRVTPTCILLFFFNHTPTPEIYTLSLHDALPICLVDEVAKDLCEARERGPQPSGVGSAGGGTGIRVRVVVGQPHRHRRSEEHTSELQSLTNLVCRLLLEKKKNNTKHVHTTSPPIR